MENEVTKKEPVYFQDDEATREFVKKFGEMTSKHWDYVNWYKAKPVEVEVDAPTSIDHKVAVADRLGV